MRRLFVIAAIAVAAMNYYQKGTKEIGRAHV